MEKLLISIQSIEVTKTVHSCTIRGRGKEKKQPLEAHPTKN